MDSLLHDRGSRIFMRLNSGCLMSIFWSVLSLAIGNFKVAQTLLHHCEQLLKPDFTLIIDFADVALVLEMIRRATKDLIGFLKLAR